MWLDGDKYYKKVVRSGNMVEIYEYEKGVKLGKKGNGGRKKNDEEKSEYTEQNRQVTNNRIRNSVIRLINSNFDRNSKFITLTFRDGSIPDLTDVKTCNIEYKKFIQRMRYKYGDFKYVTVIEFQDENGRGAVHYHMMSDLPYIPNKDLSEIWENGFVRINNIAHVDAVGKYMICYMVKDTKDIRLRGLKSYLNSKNLKRSEIIIGDKAQMILDSLEGENKIFVKQYANEYLGSLTYSEYKLSRK